MATEGSGPPTAWPLPKFHFQVASGPHRLSFQEVSGLDIETQVVEYRQSESTAFLPIKMPSIAKFGNVTMKRGVGQGGSALWAWLAQIKMNPIQRETVTISLLDETGSPTMVWTLTKAWPTKITGTDMRSQGNEVAIESIEWVHEGMSVKTG